METPLETAFGNNLLPIDAYKLPASVNVFYRKLRGRLAKRNRVKQMFRSGLGRAATRGVRSRNHS